MQNDDYKKMLKRLSKIANADIADISLDTLMAFRELSRRLHDNVDNAIIARVTESIED